MSDLELRTHERALVADPGDESAAISLLAGRIRARLVSQDRVDLAARLGDRVAWHCSQTADMARLDWARHEDRREILSALDRATVDRLERDLTAIFVKADRMAARSSDTWGDRWDVQEYDCVSLVAEYFEQRRAVIAALLTPEDRS